MIIRKLKFITVFLIVAFLIFSNNFFVLAQDEVCDLDCKYYATLIPNDTYYSKQWYLEKIKAPNAWNKISSAHEIVIAIIDGGIKINHPDLTDNIWKNSKEIKDNNLDDDYNGFIDDYSGWDFVENDPDPSPSLNQDYISDEIVHGTVVAGIAGAVGNNNQGVSGVAWNVKIMPLKTLNEKGEGDARDVIKAIDYAIANGADIINFSFVGESFSKSLEEAVARAYRAGIIMVAAAGNQQSDGKGYFLNETPLYPVCHDGNNGENMVIGVAATDTLDQKANFSAYGKCVDISAPGVSIFTTSINFGENSIFSKDYDGYWSGTSMASPMVSATVALMKQVNPKLTREEIIRTLQASSDNISKLNPNYLDFLGAGRLNVYESVNNASMLLGKLAVKLVIAKQTKGDEIIISDSLGRIEKRFFAFNQTFQKGINIDTGDVDANGHDEIIVGAGNGGGPQIKIFDYQGNLKGQFFAYDSNFRGGVNVSVGDIDGDGKDEIICGAGVGGGPQIRIFNNQGKLIGQFFAYDSNFRGGVNLAVGDIDGNGKDEIISGAGVGGGPQIKIFNNKAQLQGQFFAYDSNFRGGINVSVADVIGETRNKKKEIVTAPYSAGGPHIRIFDNYGKLQSQFFAYDSNFRGGVNISSADVDLDGKDEIISGAGPGGTAHIRLFKESGRILNSFYAFEKGFNGGVRVAGIKY